MVTILVVRKHFIVSSRHPIRENCFPHGIRSDRIYDPQRVCWSIHAPSSARIKIILGQYLGKMFDGVPAPISDVRMVLSTLSNIHLRINQFLQTFVSSLSLSHSALFLLQRYSHIFYPTLV